MVKQLLSSTVQWANIHRNKVLPQKCNCTIIKNNMAMAGCQTLQSASFGEHIRLQSLWLRSTPSSCKTEGVYRTQNDHSCCLEQIYLFWNVPRTRRGSCSDINQLKDNEKNNTVRKFSMYHFPAGLFDNRYLSEVLIPHADVLIS